MLEIIKKGWRECIFVFNNFAVPFIKQCITYTNEQPWWPGVRFLLCSLLLVTVILKYIQLKYFKRKRHNSTKPKTKKRYIYESENQRLASLPKKYTRNSSQFISSTYFLDHWAGKTSGSQIISGFKKEYAVSGCYLILISDKKVTPSTILNTYTEIYAGQSVNIAERVHQHFTGHGNGDVYADVKYGKYVFVKLFPCPKEKMNDLECTLIERFNGLDSYNRTAGGAKKRKRQRTFLAAD